MWREEDGSVAAYGYTVRGEQFLQMPGVAIYRLNPGQFVCAAPETGVDAETVTDSYRRSALPMSLQLRGMEVLHASGVDSDRGVTAICGRSTMGKSTIAYALSRRGYALWADDAIAVQPEDNSVSCLPLPGAIRLRPSSRKYFEAERKLHAITALPLSQRSRPLASILVIERMTRAATLVNPSLEPICGAPALREILPHAHCFTLRNRQRKQTMLQQYASIADRVPVFRLVYGTGLKILPAVLDLIEQEILRPSSHA